MSFLSQKARGLTELLAASFELYTASFAKVIGYILILVVCNHLFGIFVTDSIPAVDSTLTPDAQMEQQMTVLWQIMPTLLAVFLASILLSCVFYGAAVYRINNVANGREDDFVEILLLTLKKVPTFAFAWLLYIIAVTIGSFLLVIPGIILMISLLFSGYFVLLEDMGAFESIKTSHHLVWGDWWRTLLVFSVPCVILLLVFGIFGFVTGLILGSDSEGLNIGSELLSAVVAPYFYALGYLQYHDLKLRKNM